MAGLSQIRDLAICYLPLMRGEDENNMKNVWIRAVRLLNLTAFIIFVKLTAEQENVMLGLLYASLAFINIIYCAFGSIADVLEDNTKRQGGRNND